MDRINNSLEELAREIIGDYIKDIEFMSDEELERVYKANKQKGPTLLKSSANIIKTLEKETRKRKINRLDYGRE